MGNIKKILLKKEYILVAFIFSMMLIIVVPLSKGMIDFFLIISLTSAVLILLISLFIDSPTQLSTFPTLLLVLVMFRLSLNISTTRSILSEGHNGPEAVSSIIAAFGEFVVGGNMVIGIIVFIILVLINFMVITKGAGRVAEVQARFSLDALPGKQMAIDADLNSGFIDEKDAKKRREELAAEVNFYGSMDGSSKFVKGDAVAGIIITLINLLGGLLIGMFQHDLSASESAKVYTILTIGDGLVAQIPALIISTATAIIITRSNVDKEQFARGTINQLIKDYKALIVTGIALFLFGLLPGFPTGILFVMGLILSLIGYLIYAIGENKVNFLTKFFQTKEEFKQAKKSISDIKQEKKKASSVDEEKMINKSMTMDVLDLKLGLKLLNLIHKDNELIDKIKAIRTNIAGEFGFVIPQIKISDDTTLKINEYIFYIKRVPVIKGEVEVGKLLAMGGFADSKLEGKKVKEPVFNMDAIWIDGNKKDEALSLGFTVVDAPTIISTHISETIKKYAEEIITRQDIVNIIDRLKENYPIIIEEAMKVVSYGTILRVCKDLLHEKIPIIDMITILEALADIAEHTKSPEILVENVRSRLYRLITDKFKSNDGKLHVITLKGDLEQDFMNKLQEQHGVSNLMLSINEINNLVIKTKELIDKIGEKSQAKIVMIVDPLLRRRISEIYEKFGLDLPVLSHSELDTKAEFVVEGTVEI